MCREESTTFHTVCLVNQRAGMYGALMTPTRPWPSEQTRLTGTEVRRYRRGNMTAEQLAAAMTDLGMPYTRAQVTNLEAGRRSSITTGELSVLSAALGVPRLLLEFPLGRVDVVEALPGVEVSPLAALHWVETGGLAVPAVHPSGSGLVMEPVVKPSSYEDSQLIGHYRRHQHLVGQWSGGRGEEEAIRRFKHGDEQANEFARLKREQSATVGELRTLRELLRSRGLTPPELPRSFTSWALRQALGEDDEDAAS